MAEDLDVAASNFVANVNACRQCGREIAFKDKKPFDAKYVSDGVYRILNTPHWETCPVRIKQRMEANCSWCQFDKGVPILKLKRLFGYEVCEKHGDKTAEIQYRGKTYKRTRDSLKAMYHDADVERRRVERKTKKASDEMGIEVFLTGDSSNTPNE